jgi:mannose-6-phosphate isomerase-like protein (cupin superfamily)
MASIFQVDENDVPWVDYRDGNDKTSGATIRFKALSRLGSEVPSMQFVEYPPDYSDAVHSHDNGEWFIVTAGSLRMTDAHGDGQPMCGAGTAVYVPKDTPYAVHSGDQGVRYFRIVVP